MKTNISGLPGHLFAKYPTLITLEVSTDLMDSILQDGPVILQTCLMKTFQEFLAAEEYRLDKREQGRRNTAKGVEEKTNGDFDESGWRFIVL